MLMSGVEVEMESENLAGPSATTSIVSADAGTRDAESRIPAGYLHPDYAASLNEFGSPRQLPRSGGWILVREISQSLDRDAMGCYPLFDCQDWSSLHADLDALGDDLVSLALVTDPFGDYDSAYLQHCFKDVVIPFKEHYVIDLQRPLSEIGGKRRRKHAQRALRQIRVEVCEQPAQFVDTWSSLYDSLIERHQITGIRAFSRAAFARQLSIPGVVVLQAIDEGTVVGAQIYFVQGAAVHCHLGAVSEAGYDSGAFYALDWCSVEYFADKARWLDLGAGAGISSDGTDGLSQYKQGWATDTRLTYFCGRVFNRKRYEELVQAKGIGATRYFPAYREGEFA
jgi:hypothetical protein